MCHLRYMSRMGSDRTSSLPSSVLHLKVDQGQGLLSGTLALFNRVLPVQMNVKARVKIWPWL